MHSTRRVALRFGAAALVSPVMAAPVLAHAATSPPAPAGDALARLKSAMADGRFVTYQPSTLRYFNGHPTPASRDSIVADLKLLRQWFDSLITYGALNGAEYVADVAAELNYRAVIVGVWDFYNAQELANALVAAQRNPRLVAGLSLGNELILGKRGSWGDLGHALNMVRKRAPGLPLSITEPFAQYLDDPDAKTVFGKMDFMLSNIHPIFEPWFRKAGPANWADFVVRVTGMLAAVYPGPILVKETGVPTGPVTSGFTPEMQHDFYRALEKQFPSNASRAFSYFAAFDAPWRLSDFVPGGGVHPEEAHWGLFTEKRVAKKVMADFPPLGRARSAR